MRFEICSKEVLLDGIDLMNECHCKIINNHQIVLHFWQPLHSGLDCTLCSISDPRPAFQSLTYMVSVNENGPPLQLILNISVRAESQEKTRADMIFRIISGLLTAVKIVHSENRTP